MKRFEMWRVRAHASERRKWVARIVWGLRRQEVMPADFIASAWEFERLDYVNSRRLYYRQRRRAAA